jgi:hypothetical protein
MKSLNPQLLLKTLLLLPQMLAKLLPLQPLLLQMQKSTTLLQMRRRAQRENLEMSLQLLLERARAPICKLI